MPRKSPETRPSETAFRQLGLTEEIVSQWRGEMPGIDHLAHAIGVTVTRLCILHEHFVWRTCKQLGVSTGSLRLLYALRRVGPPYAQRPTDLYQLLAVTSGAVTYTINLLAKDRLIQMLADAEDGRSRLIGLTEKGVRLADDATARSIELMKSIEVSLNAREKADTIACLLRLARCWEEVSDSQ